MMSFRFMPLCIIDGESRTIGLRTIMLKRASTTRAYFTKSSTSNVVLFDQRVVARLVRLLEVIKQRAARCDHFQQPAARMVVVDMVLEMLGEIVDAFREDRNLNLGRAGVAGLVGILLDNFRFAFGGYRHRRTLSSL